ncbi:hypothetical protein RRG08_037349 [Elysia crispata]|uniref:Uncharacterized protein n=1 Tax=Elysia crispata TaxID=231223 RepID=A0AAE1AC46_9GAST|nr:hypothetical protein RRG08_037349 [Elysia crispata]
MKFSTVLAVFLFVAAVASASTSKEPCRSEWCVYNKIHRTTIDGKVYCCLDNVHRYMTLEVVVQKNRKEVSLILLRPVEEQFVGDFCNNL